ncbi:MAG TPA: hypothetical protein ENH16_04500 [Desulfobacteraceae bacterium]|nr:hypothetical protein [Desulfobacteraceae bacterium]
MLKRSDKTITPREVPESVQHEELLRLREENTRLKALLTKHSIPWATEDFIPEEAGKAEWTNQAEPQLSPA